MSVAIDRFIADWQAEGRLRSVHSERAYRECLQVSFHGFEFGLAELPVPEHPQEAQRDEHAR